MRGATHALVGQLQALSLGVRTPPGRKVNAQRVPLGSEAEGWRRMKLLRVIGVAVLVLTATSCGNTFGGDSSQTFFLASGVYMQTAPGAQFQEGLSNYSPQQVDSLPTGAVQACTGWSGAGTIYYDPTVPVGQLAAQAVCNGIPHPGPTP